MMMLFWIIASVNVNILKRGCIKTFKEGTLSIRKFKTTGFAIKLFTTEQTFPSTFNYFPHYLVQDPKHHH